MFAAVSVASADARLDARATGVACVADAALPPRQVLEAVARDFSPRIDSCGDGSDTVVLDIRGLDRLIGDPATIAAELRRTAADRGLYVRVAVAGTRTAARLLVRAHPGLTVIEAGDERRALAPLAIGLLEHVADEPDLVTLRRWGLRTLGELADLPDAAVAARLGQRGVAWQKLARGEDPAPLVPALPAERFEQALDLEWPIEELEPLSFVLGRLLEPLSAHLERRDRGAAVLHVRLHLVTREVYARSLELPAPMRDARTLRTLALLDLESNPPPAPIDRVVVAVDPTPGRVVQFSLIARPLPSPEQVSTLLARLNALLGDGRSGSPQEVDTWRPGAFAMRPFNPNSHHSNSQRPTSNSQRPTSNSQRPTSNSQRPTSNSQHAAATAQTPSKSLGVANWKLGVDESLAVGSWELGVGKSLGVGSWELGVDQQSGVESWPSTSLGPPPRVEGREVGAGEHPRAALRRFRHPIPIRVRLEEGTPSRVTTDRHGLAGGRVRTCAGPWRTSGAWWDSGLWNRDEWDVTLAGGETYRVFHDRESGNWFLEGVVD